MMKGVYPGGETLVIAGDVIATAQVLQEHLAIMPSGRLQLETAAAGIDEVLGDPRTLYGANNLAVRAALAIVTRDYDMTCSEDEVLFDGLNLTDVTLKGVFSRIAFVRNPLVSSLTLQFFDTRILAANERQFVGAAVQSGIHVPVMAVQAAVPLD